MEKISKITKVEMLQEWSNANGTFYPHKVTFENGDVAIANKKSQNAYIAGQEIKYQIVGQDNVGNNKFKEVKEDYSYGGGGRPKGGYSKGSNASFALSYAKDIAVAFINNENEDNLSSDDILALANKFNKWLNEN